uniref:XK-related protein n=1 Tax=Terrapene triunguis TaxID=2587831 RepID=A0A674KC85_9SAUR
KLRGGGCPSFPRPTPTSSAITRPARGPPAREEMKFPGSVLVSLLLFVAETGTALYLSSTYRSAGDRIWQALTLLFALLPCVLVQFNLVFIHRDLSRDRPLVLLLHILQLGPIVRWVAGC